MCGIKNSILVLIRFFQYIVNTYSLFNLKVNINFKYHVQNVLNTI